MKLPAWLLHVTCTTVILGTLLVYDTGFSKALARNEAGTYLPVFFLLAVSVGAFLTAALTNPGYVKASSDLSLQPAEIEEQSRFRNGRRLCLICHFQNPLRSKHCLKCKRCVSRFDHHCPYLGQCVGELNHRYFYVFLVTSAPLVIYSAVNLWHVFDRKVDTKDNIKYNAPILIAFLLALMASLFLSIMAGCHSYLAANGMTTWEFLSHDHISYLSSIPKDEFPFDQGLVRNLVTFILPERSPDWEVLLSQVEIKEEAVSILTDETAV